MSVYESDPCFLELVRQLCMANKLANFQNKRIKTRESREFSVKLRPHQTLRRAALCCAAKFSKSDPTKSSAAPKNLTESNAEKSGAVKDKLFSSFHFAARRSFQCSPCNDKQYIQIFFEAQSGATRLWWDCIALNT